MFELNKKLLCDVWLKTLPMFRLGLYIYSGEDLLEVNTERIAVKDTGILKNIIQKIDDLGKIYRTILNRYKIKSFKELTQEQCSDILNELNEIARRDEVQSVNKIHSTAGNPMGKQRPRICRVKEKTITYTPKQTVQY